MYAVQGKIWDAKQGEQAEIEREIRRANKCSEIQADLIYVLDWLDYYDSVISDLKEQIRSMERDLQILQQAEIYGGSDDSIEEADDLRSEIITKRALLQENLQENGRFQRELNNIAEQNERFNCRLNIYRS